MTIDYSLAHRCKRCNVTGIYVGYPGWHGMILSPTGVMHIGMENGKTACGIDATGHKWWWPT